MQKIRVISCCLLIFVLLFNFCGCGKSQATKDAEIAIDAIGEVTEDSGTAIANAEKLYGILTDNEKEDVENRLALFDAKEAYEKVLEEIAAQNSAMIYENAREAYEKLNKVVLICEKDMDDIYGAWYFGIYDAENIADYALFEKDFFTSFSSNTPHLTMENLLDAATDMGLGYNKYKTFAEDWNNCVFIAEYAIAANGDAVEMEVAMSEAEEILKELTSTYEDYTYYPKLKEYYAAVDSYVNFVLQPSGSFKQLADTVNNYETNIRTLASDVGFLFSE